MQKTHTQKLFYNFQFFLTSLMTYLYEDICIGESSSQLWVINFKEVFVFHGRVDPKWKHDFDTAFLNLQHFGLVSFDFL